MKAATLRAIHLVFTHAPGLTSLTILLTVFQGLLPLAALYVMKLIVDTATVGITSADKAPIITHLLFLLVVAAGIALLVAICRSVASYITEVQSLVLTDIITDQIQEHSLRLDLAYYENPSYHDSLHRAQMEGPTRPSRIVGDLVQIGQNCISVGAVGVFILAFSPVVGIVLIGAALPAALVRTWYSRRLYELRIRQTEAERQSQYYHWMMTDTYHAQEIRQFGLGQILRERYRTLQDSLRKARLAISRSRAIWETLTQGFITVAIFGSFTVIALMAVKGTISLGDLVMFFMGFQLCIGYTQSILSSLNALYEDQLFLRNFFAFLDLKPRVAVPKDPVPVPTPVRQEIRFEDLTFTYPGAVDPALVGVNLTLRKGEVIALVGNNGAGKSTFIKLLCRLYDPVQGRITVDGLDLKKTDPEDWRRHITVIFQDYVRYQLSARENIWMGDINRSLDTPRIEKAARQAAADTVIGRLPNEYASLLGKLFSGGHELSTGEWQKIALARAFFRDAEIVVLDEPASSLDALAEAEIFHRFRELVKGHTAVIISHRFSTILLADQVYVIDHGKIIEHGTHAELMAKNGKYATMFRAQADLYRAKSANMGF
ncbi:MAG: ABC transporter ATP-binding protein/permease [Methanoregula sp.]|nr:ABC transporter ATP-binding protein/permease [Methanoregula sp.]